MPSESSMEFGPRSRRVNSFKVGLSLACALTVGAMAFETGHGDESPDAADANSKAVAGKAHNTGPGPSVEEARRQAKVLHTAISSTLQLVHDRYYRVDQGLPIPASVLKEVFQDLEDAHHVEVRWLAVEGQAMNVDHKPQTPFDHAAFDALKTGKKDYEQTEDGIYRRASAITLSNHCLKCHVPDRKNTKDRTAGLIIAIPVQGT